MCYKPGDTGKHLSPQGKEILLQWTGMKRKERDDGKGERVRKKEGRLQMNPRTPSCFPTAQLLILLLSQADWSLVSVVFRLKNFPKYCEYIYMYAFVRLPTQFKTHPSSLTTLRSKNLGLKFKVGKTCSILFTYFNFSIGTYYFS